MKKVISTAALAMVVIVGCQAQTAKLTIKAKESEIPTAIVESFKQDFKNNTNSEWVVVPASLVGDEYLVSGYNNLNGVQPKSYTVMMKGHDINGEAMYNANGDLIYLKEHINNTALPPAVTNAVLAKYPGYQILKDQETVKQGKTKLIHYKVTIHKGSSTRVLAINSDGKILRERKLA